MSCNCNVPMSDSIDRITYPAYTNRMPVNPVRMEYTNAPLSAVLAGTVDHPRLKYPNNPTYVDKDSIYYNPIEYRFGKPYTY